MGVKAVLVDKNGDILVFSDSLRRILKTIPLEDVTLENVFLTWTKDIDFLKDYFFNNSMVHYFLEVPIDLDSCTFLDLEFDDSEKGFYLY